MRKCDSCGKAYSEGKDVFCPHCGAVASKKCIHTSLYDSSRYDRGELYDSGDKYSPYNQGTEPHAQRTPYDENADDSPVNPRTVLTRTFDKTKKAGSDDFKKIKTIISVIASIIALVIFISDSAFDSDIFDDNSFYYENEYAYEDDYYNSFAQTDAALIKSTARYDGSFSFDLKLGNIYFSHIDDSFISDHYTDVLKEEYCSTFDILIGDSENLSEDSNAYSIFIMSDEANGNGCYSFEEVPQETGEVIYINKFVLNTGHGDIEVLLPFDAFSCDEDGNITYYYDTGENDDGASLEECAPTLELSEDDFEMTLSLENKEMTIN